MSTLQALPSQKKPQKKITVDNPFESLKEVGTDVVDSLKQGTSDSWKSIWEQVLGGGKYEAKPAQKHGGELKPGQAVDLKDAAKKQDKKPTAEAPMSYFREITEAGKGAASRESQEIRQQVQSIMYELSRLAKSSKAVEQQVTQAIGTGVMKPGKYHATFFEWMLTVVRDARKRVENAGAWLHTVKKKKGFVQGMKKNMSQFMSGERSVSNQTA